MIARSAWLLLACVLALPAGAEEAARERPAWAVTLFHGWFTDDATLAETLTFDAGIDGSFRFLGAAANRRLGHLGSHLDLEAELQAVRHYAGQSHWEVNGLAVARWLTFPWDRYLDTAAAIGLGLSYATEKPEFEVIHKGGSEHVLAYLLIELEVGVPQLPRWSLVGRVHHRSGAYDLIDDDHAASNALALGLKYRF